MSKSTELRLDIRKTEKELHEVLRLFFIRNGNMSIYIDITQSFFSDKCNPEELGGIMDLSLKVTI